MVLYDDDDNGEYTDLFINASNTVNSDDATYRNLGLGNSVKFGDDEFEVLYIDPQGSSVLFGKFVNPSFQDRTNITILALALDSTDSSVANAKLNISAYNGDTLENFVSLGTMQCGFNSTLFETSDTAGFHYILANNKLGYAGYKVIKFNLKAFVEDANGDPAFSIAAGEKVYLKASAINLSNKAPIGSGTIIATVKGPSGKTVVALTKDDKTLCPRKEHRRKNCR